MKSTSPLLLLGLFLSALPLVAQEPDASAERVREKIFRVGGDVVVNENETHREVVVVGGNAIIRGTVQGNLLVVSGTARVTGSVQGDLAVVAGEIELGPAAKVGRNVVTVGSTLKMDPATQIDQNRIELTFRRHLTNLAWLADWMLEGLFRGRPFPPQVGWAWGWAALFFALHLLMAALFPRTTQATVTALEQRPTGSVVLGLLALLLLGPLLAVLIVSGLGVLAIPFILCALLLAFLFGKIAIYSFAGQHLGRMVNQPFLQRPLVGLAVGSIVFYGLYMIPVAGFVVLIVATMIGFGAAVLAAVNGLRRESARIAAGLSAAGSRAPLAGGFASPGELPPAATDLALFPRVGFWRRLAATVLDFLLLLVLLSVVKKLALPLWLAYHVVMWALTGTTVGGAVLGLKIVREDGRPVTWAVALVRALAAIFSALVLFLGFFWAGWSQDKRSWHDRIAGTTVVKVPKGMALIA